eukprot:350657-Pyramimonas_sp.AAC.1
MGFTWSLWLVQEYHMQVARRGASEKFALFDGHPVPSTQAGERVYMAYCENLNAGAFSCKQAGELRDDVQKNMEQDGFTIHDISGPPLVARVLGSVLNGGA